LRKIELGKAYSLMTLAFGILPIGSYLFRGEKFFYYHPVDIPLTIFGIVVSIKINVTWGGVNSIKEPLACAIGFLSILRND